MRRVLRIQIPQRFLGEIGGNEPTVLTPFYDLQFLEKRFAIFVAGVLARHKNHETLSFLRLDFLYFFNQW